ncbi:MAG: Inward rectifier potassium channel Irk [Ferruginibacter sp.]|nr:Inward rectifier potassium channel Irk [Ferruginibacter sp.]
MALLRKINTKAKAEINTGFGTNTSDYGGRFVNKDGRPNIEKRGVSFFNRLSWYHTLLQIPRWKFLLLLLCFYMLLNLIFAGIYYAIGIENLAGIRAGSRLEEFGEAYFFSSQTFTTVGYGRISPHGFAASSVAALEALVGLLSFAIATGLFYGRFSKPKAFLRFSENAVLAPFKDGLALMMRVAPYKNNNLSEAEAKLSAGLMMEENGKLTNKFFQMELEYSRVNSLSLSWTIVHPINEDSPFYSFSMEDFSNTKGEILVYVKAFDDMFSNTVVARTSYTLKEVVVGAKFIPMYHRDEEHKSTILDLEKINSFNPADISFAFKGDSVASGHVASTQ